MIDLDQARRFLDLMAEGESVTFQTFGDASKSRSLARILHGDLDQHADELSALNSRGAGVFWMVNYGDGKGRAQANVVGVRSIFADLDGAPLKPVLEAGLEPHAVVESSPGRFHAYWATADCAPDRFEPLQRALARRFDSDPSVIDLPRVMRLPGFVHRKGIPFTTRILSLASLQPYPVQNIIGALGLDEVGPVNVRSEGPTQPAGALIAVGRNNALTRMAGTMQRKGMTLAAIEAALLAENLASCSPPLADDEVLGIARSVRRYQPSAPADEAAADAWGDPLLPGTRLTPEIPASILPGIFGAHAAAVAESTQTPPAIATMFTISILATVLQGRFEVAPFGDDYREPLAICTNTCYPVGGRKTAVFGAGAAPLVRWGKLASDRARPEIHRRLAARAVAEKRIEKLKHDAARADDGTARARIQDEIRQEMDGMPDELKPPRIFTTNATPERTEGMLAEQGGKLGILSDESDTFLNLSGGLRGGMASLDVVLKGHAGSAIRVDRQGREAHLDRPTLSMGLIVQPESFAELAAGKRLRATGVLARYLYAIPKSNIGTRDVRQRKPIPRRLDEGYHEAIMDLLDGYEDRGREPRVLPFSAEALVPWLDFADGVEKHQGEGGRFEAISDWTSKLPGAAARLAAVFQLAEHGLEAREVGLVAVERALNLCRLLIPHAQAAFAMLGADDTDADALAVLRWIRVGSLRDFTRRDAQRSMHGRFSKVERLERALAALRDLYIISGEKKAATGGRASAFYLVNPKLYITRGAI